VIRAVACPQAMVISVRRSESALLSAAARTMPSASSVTVSHEAPVSALHGPEAATSMALGMFPSARNVQAASLRRTYSYCVGVSQAVARKPAAAIHRMDWSFFMKSGVFG